MYKWSWVIFAKKSKFHDAGGPDTVVSPKEEVTYPSHPDPPPPQPNPSWHPTQSTLTKLDQTKPSPTQPNPPCLLTQTCYSIYLKYDSD